MEPNITLIKKLRIGTKYNFNKGLLLSKSPFEAICVSYGYTGRGQMKLKQPLPFSNNQRHFLVSSEALLLIQDLILAFLKFEVEIFNLFVVI